MWGTWGGHFGCWGRLRPRITGLVSANTDGWISFPFENLTLTTFTSQGSPRSDETPRWFVHLCRWRVRVGFLLIVGVVAESIVMRETPLDMRKFTPLLGGAFALIALGTLVRLIAVGTLFKNTQLSTKGIYSLCRHPLYFGSTLLFIGLGLILHDSGWEYWYLGLPYVAFFFGAAAWKEERFLRDKFGAAFDAYKAATPAFLPLGKWRAGEFSWGRAMKRGGVGLIACVVLMLAGMQVMVLAFGPK